MTYFLIFSKAIRDIVNIIAASDRPKNSTTAIMNICSQTNNYAVKLNRIFFPKHNFPPHFLESY